ncbi:MAG: hypothetical protein IJY28_02525 [Clostridia bacterium]|nr:hypothetical protein [Clostridia bacterium]
MTENSVVLQNETVSYEAFRLTYTLLRTDPADPSRCPLFGIACTVECRGRSAGTCHHPAVTGNAAAARQLFRFLTEHAVFPPHIADVIHDFRENGILPDVFA